MCTYITKINTKQRLVSVAVNTTDENYTHVVSLNHTGVFFNLIRYIFIFLVQTMVNV